MAQGTDKLREGGGASIRFLPEDLVDRVPDPGWYRASVAGVWKRPTDTGSVAVKVKFVILDDGDFEEVEIWDQFVVEGARAPDTGKEGEQVARRRLARLMRACGIRVEPDVDLPLAPLEGCELLLKVVPDVFQGQPRSRVKAYRPLGRPGQRTGVSEEVAQEVKEDPDTPF